MNFRFSLLAVVMLSSFAASAQMLSVVPDVEHGAYVVSEVHGVVSCRDANPVEAVSINRPHGQPMHILGKAGGVRTNAGGGLDIILRGTAQLDANPAAKAAFERAAEIWENRINNPITIIVDVDFGPTRFGEAFDANTIAAASTASFIFDPGDYAEVRGLLLARADNAAETTIYNALPLTSVPTDGGALDRFVGPSALLRVLNVVPQFPPVATPDDPANTFPRIGFNSAFAYDFDPSNGITFLQKDFEGVVVHEIGHMLGFTSRVGATELGSTAAPTALDLFRFRPGITLANFTTADRILSSGGDQIFFAGAAELGFSTGRGDGTGGDERQASHWKDDSLTGVRVGIMDPTLANAARSELTDNDLLAFGMIGWEIDGQSDPPPPQTPAAPTNLVVTTATTSQITFGWTDNATNETEYRIEQKIGAGTFSDIGSAAANATSFAATNLTPGTQYTFRVRARNAAGDSGYSNEASATTTVTPAPCVAGATTVCLLNNRFKVVIDYVNPFSNPPNQPGTFLAARLLQGAQNPDTALFGFSSAEAVEVVVRVQDTRPFAPRFDIYYGGMTDVGYTVTVTDTQTGVVRQYRNIAGQVGGGVDRNSFPAN